jgi:hypothetical protein
MRRRTLRTVRSRIGLRTRLVFAHLREAASMAV